MVCVHMKSQKNNLFLNIYTPLVGEPKKREINIRNWDLFSRCQLV